MSNAKVVAGNVSQRAKKSQKNKTVFKPVLDNPFTLAWPVISENTQRHLLEALVDVVSCLKNYHIQRGFHSKKNKRARQRQAARDRKEQSLEDKKGSLEGGKRKRVADEEVEPSSKRQRIDTKDHDTTKQQASIQLDQISVEARPEIADHVVFGINEVAKALERHISKIRGALLNKESFSEETEIPIAIFACLWDLNPPTILSHIPHLVASANTLLTILATKSTEQSATFPDMKLINLPKGSESSVSEAIGMRRVSIILLTSKATVGSRLLDLLNKVPKLATPWLIPTTNPTIFTPHFRPTHIKHLKTTAPVDMRAAKAERSQAKKEAKQGKKARTDLNRPDASMKDDTGDNKEKQKS
ncbi:hypothetical protein CPB86DRAFT_808932 [Serendipita vermifera]|nr:hypothetical protein CPB86DRAFT_808932 [Serendipita vermifera]